MSKQHKEWLKTAGVDRDDFNYFLSFTKGRKFEHVGDFIRYLRSVQMRPEVYNKYFFHPSRQMAACLKYPRVATSKTLFRGSKHQTAFKVGERAEFGGKSFSLDRKEALNFGGVALYVLEGHKEITFVKHSKFDFEKEVILKSGTKARFTSIYEEKNGIVVYVATTEDVEQEIESNSDCIDTASACSDHDEL